MPAPDIEPSHTEPAETDAHTDAHVAVSDEPMSLADATAPDWSTDLWTMVYGLGLVAILIAGTTLREWWTKFTASKGAVTDGVVEDAAESLADQHLRTATDLIANGIETWRTGRTLGEVAARIHTDLLERGIVPKRGEAPPGVREPSQYLAWLLDTHDVSIRQIARDVLGDGVEVMGQKITADEVAGNLLAVMQMRNVVSPEYVDVVPSPGETPDDVPFAMMGLDAPPPPVQFSPATDDTDDATEETL